MLFLFWRAFESVWPCLRADLVSFIVLYDQVEGLEVWGINLEQFNDETEEG